MTSFSNAITGSLEFTVTWKRNGVSHEEWFLGRKVNPIHDIFPRGMRDMLEGKNPGETVSKTYPPGSIMHSRKPGKIQTLPHRHFDSRRRFAPQRYPQQGRFYPVGRILYLPGIYTGLMIPCRIISVDQKTFTVDMNHPLASTELNIEAKIQYLNTTQGKTYGFLTHWREATCDWGPGLQAALPEAHTDFIFDDFYSRKDETKNKPIIPAMDANAASNLVRTYERFIVAEANVLVISHETALPIECIDAEIHYCTPEELPTMQQKTAPFDTVIFNQCFEYHSNPQALIHQALSHLKPDGTLLAGFSTRLDEQKATLGWMELHEFERMGFLLQHFKENGIDGAMGTISMRNDWRPENDPLFLPTKGVSDSIYVVWGQRKA